MKVYKLTLLKDLPEIKSGSIVYVEEEVFERFFSKKEFWGKYDGINRETMQFLRLQEKEGWVSCELLDLCFCQYKESIYIVPIREIGYGRSTGSAIDFNIGRVHGWVDYSCDGSNKYGHDILFCPFCGRSLKGEND